MRRDESGTRTADVRDVRNEKQGAGRKHRSKPTRQQRRSRLPSDVRGKGAPAVSGKFRDGLEPPLAQFSLRDLRTILDQAKYRIDVIKALFEEAKRRISEPQPPGPMNARVTKQLHDDQQALLDRAGYLWSEYRRRQRERVAQNDPTHGRNGAKAPYLVEYETLLAQFERLLQLVMLSANTAEAAASRRRSEAELQGLGRKFADWAQKFPSAQFPWPSTYSAGGGGPARFDRAEVSPLTVLGYHVGETAKLEALTRHRLLDWAFSNVLPPVISSSYMQGWGPPGTAARLERMANHIANCGKQRRKFCGGKDASVRHWQADLDYLKQRYYLGKFGFGWPTTN